MSIPGRVNARSNRQWSRARCRWGGGDSAPLSFKRFGSPDDVITWFGWRTQVGHRQKMDSANWKCSQEMAASMTTSKWPRHDHVKMDSASVSNEVKWRGFTYLSESGSFVLFLNHLRFCCCLFVTVVTSDYSLRLSLGFSSGTLESRISNKFGHFS